MTVAATVTSVLCAITLVVDRVRTKDFRKNGASTIRLQMWTHNALRLGSGLTTRARSLLVARVGVPLLPRPWIARALPPYRTADNL